MTRAIRLILITTLVLSATACGSKKRLITDAELGENSWDWDGHAFKMLELQGRSGGSSDDGLVWTHRELYDDFNYESEVSWAIMPENLEAMVKAFAGNYDVRDQRKLDDGFLLTRVSTHTGELTVITVRTGPKMAVKCEASAEPPMDTRGEGREATVPGPKVVALLEKVCLSISFTKGS